MEDLNFCGSLFTWTNKQEGDAFVAKKLDRIMVNEFWMEKFGNTFVESVLGGPEGCLIILIFWLLLLQ